MIVVDAMNEHHFIVNNSLPNKYLQPLVSLRSDKVRSKLYRSRSGHFLSTSRQRKS